MLRRSIQSEPWHALPAILLLAVAAAGCPGRDRAPQPNQPPRVLRVCADPNNLPFSNQQRQGFENELAELVAHELGPPRSTPGGRSAGLRPQHAGVRAV